MSAILIMLGSLVLAAIAYFVTLALAAKLLRFEKRGGNRIALVTTAWFALTIGAFLVVITLADSDNRMDPLLELAVTLGVPAIEIVFIRRLLKTTFPRAIGGWAMTMAVRVAFVVVMLMIVRAHLVEAFKAPTQSMSPAFLCRRGETRCPKCGGTVYYDLDPEILAGYPRSPRSVEVASGTCINCGMEEVQPLSSLTPLPADRFFVTKFLAPRRWDPVIYWDGNVIYIKRLAALPGEDIVIDREGHLFIDGKRVDLPSEIPHGAFKWPTTIAGPIPDDQFALKPDTKLHLAGDEYFMLGDNSNRSLDSRFHGPTKKGNIIGVATWTYWPLSRMRIFR